MDVFCKTVVTSLFRKRSRLKEIQLILGCLFLTGPALAQDHQVSGKVTQEDGVPLPGVSVVMKGSSQGTITDTNGDYRITVPANSTLVFSFVGYVTKEIPVSNRIVINPSLIPDVSELEEVVVVGYGTVKKSDLTGSVSSIKGEEIQNLNPSSFEQALAGRAPGVVVTRNSGVPGAASTIKIRGINSMTGSEPLYVIDGQPMNNVAFDQLVEGAREGGSISPLSSVNPNDIESIEILKDASATAIYGSRGANGVVLITTKQGQTGEGKVSFSADYGISNYAMERKPQLFNAGEYVLIRQESVENGQGGKVFEESYLDSARAGLIPTYDWQDAIYRTGVTQDYNLSLSGGEGKIKYLISGNLFDAKGIIIKSDYRRFSGRINLTADLKKWLTVGTNLSMAVVNTNQNNTSTHFDLTRGTNSVVARAQRAAPVTNPYNEDGTYYTGVEGVEVYSPLVGIQANNYNNTSSFPNANIYADIKILNGLRARSQFSYQARNTQLRFYQTDDLPETISRQGWARTNDGKVNSWTLSNTLSYNRQFNKHAVNAVVGQTARKLTVESIGTENYGFENDLLGIYAMPTAAFYTADRASQVSLSLLSFLGRINYTYNNKFLFTLTGRVDGSSKFASNYKYGFFPAGAVAYRLSEEPFMDNLNFVSNLKLRASYGLTGNQALQPYQSLAQLAASKKIFGDGGGGEAFSTIYFPARLANRNLKWETTAQLDLGLDLGLLQNRLNLTADYYQKVTNDLLVVGYQITSISGFSTATVNLGEMETKGLDLALNAVLVDKANFGWDADLNFSLGKTKIRSMGGDTILSGMPHGWISGGTQRLIIGQELGAFWGYQETGITQFSDFQEFYNENGNLKSREEMIAMYNANPSATYTPVDEGYPSNLPAQPGEVKYLDRDENGIINASDQTVIGYAQPDFTFGFRSSFRYKNLDLSVYVDGQQGMDIFNLNGLTDFSFGRDQQLKEVFEKRWTPENPSEEHPRVSSVGRIGGDFKFSDRYIEDASFTRIQSIILGYEFGQELVSRLSLSRLRIAVSATNVYTFTNYRGYSPDVSLTGSNNLSMGHAYASYPVPRTFSLSLNIEF